MAAKVRKGDKVVVISGKDKGKRGEVLRVIPDEGRAVVQGLNTVTRHTRQSMQTQGGLVKKEAPIHLSNLSLIDPSTDKPTRVGFKDARRRYQSSHRPPFGRADRPLKGAVEPMATRLQTRYETEIRKALQEKFNYPNPMEVPKISKIVINMGVGEASQDAKKIEGAVADLAAISGQKPVVTRARTSIATFKLRENQPVGCKVTLRRDRMYEFLDRLINIALPRVRDFRGVSPKSFDGQGNYALGLKEQMVFPEINYDRVDKVRGMDIIIVTTAKNSTEAKALLQAFDMPFAS